MVNHVHKRKAIIACMAAVGLTGLAGALLAQQEQRGKGVSTNLFSDTTLPEKKVAGPYTKPKVRVTPQMRQEAAEKLKSTTKGAMLKLPTPGPGGQPNYFGPEPNFANSPLPTIRQGQVVSNTGMRKFINGLPGLGEANKNNLGQYIPVAVPDTSTYPGSDYYELGAVQYKEKMHADLQSRTLLRGYVQLNTGSNSSDPVAAAHYLGPLIVAHRNRSVRVKFSNLLPTGLAGNLFIPVDTTVMGAGTGPNMGAELYTQNRADLHLHGGNTPWISDGTPHQWITPAGETTSYVQGVSIHPVPDMPIPTVGDGTATYYYTNQQSARLMFIHDHSYGITRLNVYAGEVLPYIVTDQFEEQLLDRGLLPNLGGVYTYGVPLVIQDKTFVPPSEQLRRQDPTWNNRTQVGSLWFPHVYMPNQNPNMEDGANPLGRWDYGPWFWPPFNAGAGLVHGPILDPNGSGMMVPGTPNPSIVPEAFLDTPVVNGTAYPYVEVERKPYRFRILNGCNDRYLNLQLYNAEPVSVSITDGGSGYTKVPEVIFNGQAKKKAKGVATIENGQVISVQITDPGSGYTIAPTITFEGGGKVKRTAKAIASLNTEVAMIPACPTETFPSYYPTPDGRAGGFPDPASSGPSMIQIGTEGGFLPNPVVLPNTPIGYQYNRRDITVLNVLEKTLFLGPAERADVIIDFSQVPEDVSYVILYNDAPAPVPGFDPRNDYYTNGPDLTDTGGAPSTLAGYGPNTRTILQFRLIGKKGPSFNLKALQEALPKIYTQSQLPPIVPEATYPGVFKANSNTYSRIEDTSLTFTPLGSSTPTTINMKPKSIIESFESDYGRMNATLGTEMVFTNDGNQTSVPLAYRDPPTEFTGNYENQLWKITHNGVDTHAIHFHLFNVQLVNRVGWDGMIKPPDPNEIGWKETVRMNPLEDVIIALQPIAPSVPFAVPNSVRLLDPTMMEGMTFSSFDPLSGAKVTTTNVPTNFGWEYVWHCHLLGHEENDMMRPLVFNLDAPSAPMNPVATAGQNAGEVIVTFDQPIWAGPGGIGISSYTVVSVPGSITATGTSSPITVTGLTSGTTYTFNVTATNANGFTSSIAPSNSVVAP